VWTANSAALLQRHDRRAVSERVRGSARGFCETAKLEKTPQRHNDLM
jgi:hypothetical protein